MSVTLLALDTSAERCSVALTHPDGYHLRQSESARKHADEILTMIAGLLKDHSLSLQGLDALAMVMGPGSFTGLRIGAAVVQGLAFGADLPVIGVSSLAMLARAAVETDGNPRYAVCCMHAREDEYYLGIYYDTGAGVPVTIVADRLASSEDIRRLVANDLPTAAQQQWWAVGDGWLQPSLQELSHEAEAVMTAITTHAGTLTDIAAMVPSADWLDASAALPVYLKDDMAYRKV